tara:strand:- start:207 stop:1679 length:1473 start_codon:yes stop_codon:yes gene_type:complete
MLNPFFQQGTKAEQNLIQDLVNEQLRMYGVDVYYIPRLYVNEKTIIREVVDSEFRDAYPIEAYVDTSEGYEGSGEIMSKFGIESQDDLTLVISRERYEEYIKPLIENKSNIKLSSRPKEGDLIFFPLGNRLFEIKFVEHEKPFYQLKKNYVYELRCELFRIGDEIIDTDVDAIDNALLGSDASLGAAVGSGSGSAALGIGADLAGTRVYTMLGIGSTASAQAAVFDGGVRYVTITNRGTGYTSTPDIIFSSAPAIGGSTAVGVATMITGVVDYCSANLDQSRVQGVRITNSGYGYTSDPLVRSSGGGGSGFVATASTANGVVGIITVTDGGSGYSGLPTISFTAPVGSGATAIAEAVVSSAGTITAIQILDGGAGYATTNPPTITVADPYLGGSGDYIIGETIVGSSSSTTAVVKYWNSTTKQLNLSRLTGDFNIYDEFVGAESGARHKATPGSIADKFNLPDPFASNDDFETEADAILDFSETNPFGRP